MGRARLGEAHHPVDAEGSVSDEAPRLLILLQDYGSIPGPQPEQYVPFGGSVE